MNYQNYINLGFKRHDLQCAVEMKQTGYGGYSLEKKLSNSMELGVCFGELDKPKLYIPKGNGTFHVIPISFECLQDIIRNDKSKK